MYRSIPVRVSSSILCQRTIAPRLFAACSNISINNSNSHNTSHNTTFNRKYQHQHHQYMSTSYYDSQSGMHVAIHNENEISVFVKPKLKLDTSILEMTDKLNSLKQEFGFHGIVIDRMETSTSIEEQLTNIFSSTLNSKNKLDIFIPFSSIIKENIQIHKKKSNNNINLMFEYKSSNETESYDSLIKNMTKYVTTSNTSTDIDTDTHHANTKTVIGIHHYNDPILVANGVASLIDETGGGELVLLTSGSNSNNSNSSSPPSIDSESIINLCEELSYLDIPGQTMKSRLVVDLEFKQNGDDDNDEEEQEETLEECLFMGINKYVICETKLEWFQSIIHEHGKSLRPPSKKE